MECSLVLSVIHGDRGLSRKVEREVFFLDLKISSIRHLILSVFFELLVGEAAGGIGASGRET